MNDFLHHLVSYFSPPQQPLVSPLPTSNQFAQTIAPSMPPSSYMATMSSPFKKVIEQNVPPQSQEDAANVLHKEYESGIQDPKTLSYSLATLGHETAGTFKPIKEINGPQQAIKYGYKGGPNYYGRGYIQITGLPNYQKYGQMIGVDLATHPELATNPEVAAKVYAAYMAENKQRLEGNLEQGNLKSARRVINGPGAFGTEKVNEKYYKYLNDLH